MMSACGIDSAEETSAAAALSGEVITGTTEEEVNPASEEPAEAATEGEEVAAPEEESDDSASEETAVPDEIGDEEFVRVQDYLPGVYMELKYATEDNFTGQVIYDFEDAYLRYGTVQKLQNVYETVIEDGYSIKIWDAYRPISAQYRLWEAYPDARYVANPGTGYSSHSRGNTLDLTLVLADGTEVEMPSSFDDFSTRADRNYDDCSAEAAWNAGYLETVMVQCGFKPYSGEWWHYSDLNVYEAADEVLP